MVKDYAAITSLVQLKNLADKMISDGKYLGFDLETGYYGADVKKRSVDHYNASQFVVGFSFTNDPSWARYVPLAHDDGGNIDATPEEVWEVVRDMLTKCNIVAHNAKFERAAVWKAAKIVLGAEGSVTDTMLDVFVTSVAMTPNFRTMIALKEIVLELLGHQMMHIEELWPDMPSNKKPSLRFNTLPVSPTVVAYACEDAAWVLPLRDKVTELAKSERKFMHDLEHAIMEIMEEVERYGVHVDWPSIEEAYAQAQQFTPLMEAHVKQELGKVAGRDLSELNLNSSLQMKKLLFKEIGMSTTRLTKKGQEDGSDMENWQKMSTDKKSLVALADEHEAVRQLLEFREVKNLVTRLKKWLTEYNQSFDGRVHANYKQAGAESDESTAPGSGRFSSSDPAIQQLPKKWKWVLGDEETGENGKDFWKGNFRNFITASPNTYLLTYDYSQVELRMLAGASQEPTLLEAFENEDDVHTLTAAMMLGKDPASVDYETERPLGKTFNFALMYGMGPKSLSEQLGIDLGYAKALYVQYFEKFSNVAAWKASTESTGKDLKYVETIFQRKIPVWQLYHFKESIKAQGMRLLINAPIQGAAADYMKIAMFRSAKVLRERGWWGKKVCIIMNQHDALTFEAHNSVDPNELREVLQSQVVFGSETYKVLKGYPPIRADWELGQKWGSSEKWLLTQKAAFDGQHWVVQPEPELSEVKFSLDSKPYSDEWSTFISTLKGSPGNTKIHFAIPGGEIGLPFSSHVTSSNVKDLKKIFKHGKVEVL